MYAHSLRLRDGNAIEKRLTGKQGTGQIKGYLNGKRRAFQDWGPVPNSRWVELAAQAHPGSRVWFATPMWYLLEEMAFTPDQLITCAELLPEVFREALLFESRAGMPAALRLQDVQFHWVYQFTVPASPQALGAMACGMRRAELAGDGPTFRWAAVGLIWLLDQYIARLDPWVAEPLVALRRYVLERFASMVYLHGLVRPILPQDIARFEKIREDFIAWSQRDQTLEEDISQWPPNMQMESQDC